jgi:aspartate aminotransferase-like enzyme
LNPLAEIAEIAHHAGALVIVDAVASIGAEPLAIDAWDLDVTVVSAQKALGGPAGVCAVAISERAWETLEHNPAAPTDSLLSLLDWRSRWIRDGRRELPLIPAHLETRALDVALERIEQEGLEATIGRHRQASNAARAGLRALALEPWVADGPGAAAISTLLAVPDALRPAQLLARVRSASPDAPVGLAPSALAASALRINHTGDDARLSRVLAAIAGLALGLRAHGLEVDAGAALAGVLDGWHAQATGPRPALAAG